MSTHKMEQEPLKDADVMAFAVVRDAVKARVFYEQTLGLSTSICEKYLKFRSTYSSMACSRSNNFSSGA